VQEWSDVLRVLILPVFAWTAWHDIQTRRVPNWVWKPPLVLGVVLLVWEGWQAVQAGGYTLELFLVPTAISLLFVIPLAVGFHMMGGFGAADMKALVVIAVLFPTYPSYIVPNSTLTFPMVESPVHSFAMTVLTNGVLVGVAYPLTLLARNLLGRSIPEEPWVILVGRAVDRSALLRTHGRLLETPRGYTRAGLDLDALRMYLTWRDTELTELVADPDTARNPRSIPEETSVAGDGAVGNEGPEAATDGADDGESAHSKPSVDDGVGDPGVLDGADGEGEFDGAEWDQEFDDPWGAEAFLEDIPGSAYGTTPALLREGLDLLTTRDRVWVSPGIPFLVPLVIGLFVAVVYGDLLVAMLRALGLLPAF
jgi:preflagellin peptidase FlaK